jgi:hypothetical protein
MSYLRGPLTRSEIELLTPDEGASTNARSTADPGPPPAAPVATGGVQTTQAPSAPPPVPAPLRSRYLNSNGGNVANPYLYVKTAVRYKVGTVSTDETQHSFAFRLDPDSSPAEVVTAEPVEVDEQAISDTPLADVSYSQLPVYVATQGTKALEKALRDRLDDQFALELLYDAQTKMVSMPEESAEAFALRVANAPAIASKRRTLETRLQSKRATLSAKQEEIKARGLEKWASLGTSILSNMSILTGRKRSVTGVGGVLSKQRMESTARSTSEKLQAEIADLEQQLSELVDVDPLRFETRPIKPARNDVAVLRYDILWIT